MERMYYVQQHLDSQYVLKCASYGFSDQEEIYSATDDLRCSDDYQLKVGEYVHFTEEQSELKNDHLLISGQPKLYHNQLTEADRKEYDHQLELSMAAYQNNDQQGIKAWEDYLKSYEDIFMAFEEL